MLSSYTRDHRYNYLPNYLSTYQSIIALWLPLDPPPKLYLPQALSPPKPGSSPPGHTSFSPISPVPRRPLETASSK